MTQRFIILLSLSALLMIGCATPRSSAPGAGEAAKSKAARPRALDTIVLPKTLDKESEQRIETLAHFGAGVALDLEDKPDQALEEYLKSADKDASYEPLVLEAARRLIRNNKFDEALALLIRGSKQPDASGELYSWLGLAYSAAGQTNEAFQATQTAIKKMPRNLLAYQSLSQMDVQLGKTNDAVKVVDQAAKQTGVEPEFLVGVAELYSRYMHLGIIKDSDGKPKIMEVLDRAAKLESSNPSTLYKIADGYLLLDELKKAEPIYLRLAEEYPELPNIRQKLVNLYIRTGNKEKASEQLKKIRLQNPTDPQTYLFLGSIAVEQKQYKEASEYYETALQLNPNIEQLYYDLAGLKISTKKPEQALEVLEKARALFKLNFTLEFYEGVANSLLQKYSEAIRHYTSAELLAKTSEPSRLTHLFYYQMGSAYERNGDMAQAETYFRKCLELSPKYAEAMNYMGYMWAEKGMRLEEAHALIAKAVELEPDNAAYLDSLGWVLFKQRRYDDALKYMKLAVKHTEEADPTLYDHLGDIYAAQKNLSEARNAWKKSLEVAPSAEVKKKFEAASKH
jgi:tetratricopeptide (TPR) repeat protein